MSCRRLVKICPPVEELAQDVKRNIPCEIEGCSKILPQMSAYRMHLIKVHKITTESLSSSSVKELEKTLQDGDMVEYHCPAPKCVYHLNSVRFFSSHKRLRQHYLAMHAEKKFECTRCRKKFGMERTLNDHLKSCGYVHMCLTCGSPYSTRQAVLTHCSRNSHKPPEKPTAISGGQMTVEEHKEMVKKMALERLKGEGDHGDVLPEKSANSEAGKMSEKSADVDGAGISQKGQDVESAGISQNNSKNGEKVPVLVNGNRPVTASSAINIQPERGSVGKLLLPKSVAMLLPVEFRTVGVKAYAVPAQPARLICIPNNAQTPHTVLRKGPRPLACKPVVTPNMQTCSVARGFVPDFVGNDASTITDAMRDEEDILTVSGNRTAVAETQTTGDYILKKAMLSADIPIQRESRGSQVSPKAKVKRTYESQQSIETQTAGTSPKVMRRATGKESLTSVGLVDDSVASTEPQPQYSFAATSPIDGFDLLDMSHNETQTMDMWESISTQTLESFLQNPEVDTLPEVNSSKTSEQCIQTHDLHDSFIHVLEEASVSDPLLSSTASEKYKAKKRKVSTGTGTQSSDVNNRQLGPTNSAISILPSDVTRSVSTVSFGVGTDAGTSAGSSDAQFELSLWNNEVLLMNRNRTGISPIPKAVASCSTDLNTSQNCVRTSQIVSKHPASSKSRSTATSTSQTTSTTMTDNFNVSVMDEAVDSLLDKRVNTGTGTQTIGELIDSAIGSCSSANNIGAGKIGVGVACETQTSEQLSSNDIQCQTIDSIFDSSTNMQTQTMDDMFDQFLSNMETQTTTDDLLASLGLNTMETQTMTQLGVSSSVETQTTFQGQTTIPLTVQTDMETQTLFPGCELSQLNQMDMETQTAWEDLKSFMLM